MSEAFYTGLERRKKKSPVTILALAASRISVNKESAQGTPV